MRQRALPILACVAVALAFALPSVVRCGPDGCHQVLDRPSDTDDSRQKNLPRYQREEMEFAPGEYSHQSFKRQFFSGFCGNCHGAISGRQVDVAVQPDMLTQASQTASRDSKPINLNLPPAERGKVEGPPATP